MAAPIGNKFWMLRLKHGREKEIETHEELWENYIEYAEYCHNNPFIEPDFVGKDATKVERPKMVAQTKDGFALACGLCSWEVVNEYKRFSKDFSEVVTRIEKNIINQKFQGAAAGLLNANIISRDLGLIDKKEQSITANVVGVPVYVDDDED